MGGSKAGSPLAVIEAVNLDCSPPVSAKSAATHILNFANRIELFFLDAGEAGTAPSLTQDGYEWPFGVNHLAHAKIVQVTVPLLLQTAHGGD